MCIISMCEPRSNNGNGKGCLVIAATYKLSTCSFLVPIAERGGMVDRRGVTTEIYSLYLPAQYQCYVF